MPTETDAAKSTSFILKVSIKIYRDETEFHEYKVAYEDL